MVLYGKKQPFDLCILGDDSDKVIKHERERLKSLKLKAKEKQDDEHLDDELIDQLLEVSSESVIVRLAGIRSRDKEPVTLLGKELTNDEESYRLLVDKIPDIKDFITGFAKNRKNFLSDRKGN